MPRLCVMLDLQHRRLIRIPHITLIRLHQPDIPIRPQLTRTLLHPSLLILRPHTLCILLSTLNHRIRHSTGPHPLTRLFLHHPHLKLVVTGDIILLSLTKTLMDQATLLHLLIILLHLMDPLRPLLPLRYPHTSTPPLHLVPRQK